MADTTMQRPEGALIAAHLAAHPGLHSMAAAAALAGISRSYWAQVVSGHNGARAPRREAVVANARTLARMAQAIGLGPADLAGAGRGDAAEVLVALEAHRPAPPGPRGGPSEVEAAITTVLARAGIERPAEQLEVLAAMVADLAGQARRLRR